MDFDQKLLLLQSQLSRRYVYTASVTSGETSSLATGLPAKPQETITRIQFNIYINQSNFLGSLQAQAREYDSLGVKKITEIVAGGDPNWGVLVIEPEINATFASS